MSRPKRLHVPGGLYYVTHRRNSHRALFETEDDYLLFERIFAKALERFEVRAHAFCWMPEEIHLVVQIGQLPLSRFMQAIASAYARRLNLPSHGHLFLDRYDPLLVDPKLRKELVGCVHKCTCSADSPAVSPDFPWSSHRAYLGLSPLPWLTTRPTLRTFADDTDEAVRLYAEYMAEPIRVPHPKALVDHGCQDPRIVGDAEFVASLPRSVDINRRTKTLEDVIQSVLSHQNLSREALLNDHTAVLARALVAFHAVKPGIATYAEVGEALNHSASSLQEAVTRLSRSALYAHLFRRGALLPLVSIPKPRSN